MRSICAVPILLLLGSACGRIGYDPLAMRGSDGGDGSVAQDATMADAGADAGTVQDAGTGDADAGTPPLGFAFLTAGGDHACGLTTTGAAYCWGRDTVGQLGENADGDNNDEVVPVLVDVSALTPGTQFQTLSAGQDATCGISTDGRLFCWGNGLGSGVVDRDIPTETAQPPGVILTTISVGASHACSTGSDGNAYCWGQEVAGELGNGPGTTSSAAPSRVDNSALEVTEVFLQIHAGFSSCGVSNFSNAYCWGSDSFGQLGEDADGDNLDELMPSEVDRNALGTM